MTQESNSCSRCGSCLGACAVYQLLLEEPASPRGRLATLAALREGRLPDTPQNRRFIEACMLCGRCEAACHKGVKGRDEILAMRLLWRQAGKGAWWKRLLTLFYGRRFLRLARPFLTLLAQTPLRRHLLLPRADARGARSPKPSTAGNSEIALFPGCVLGVFYPRLLRQMVTLLQCSGVRVQVLWDADCCGFPALSQGDLASFARKKKKNERLFQERGVKTLIVPCATGVMAMRAHYQGDFSVWDLGTYLLTKLPEITIRHPAVVNAADGFWLFHRPCHQPKRDESIGWFKEIAACPKIRMPAREETDCCGFGGMFSIGFPSVSRAILHRRQDLWLRQGIGGIVTDCPGCYLQFRAAGTMPVLFLSELFAAQPETVAE